MANIYSGLPAQFDKEVFDELLHAGSVRIERIVSRGHTSSDWYDQTENEWVMVLEGAASILFEDGVEVTLNKGDYIDIPAHTRHKVNWTDPDKTTIWLAIFYL
jgi:cupin 2 domain-containing protein